MKNLTIAKRITLAFMAVIAITAIMGLYSYNRAVVIKADSILVAQKAIPALHASRDMAFRTVAANMRAYKHIESEDEKDMTQLEEEIKAQSAANETNVAILDSVFPDGEIHALLETAKVARQEYLTSLHGVLDASRKSTNAQTNSQIFKTARTQMDPLCDKYTSALEAVSAAIKDKAMQQSEAIVTAADNSQTGMLAGLVLAIIAALVISVAIVRSTNQVLTHVAGALNDGANQVASAAGQVSSASQTLAEGTSEQAASLEETSSSLEEMSSMTKRNNASAAKAKELAAQTRLAADTGATDMHAMSASMAAIKDSSTEIGKIIKTIDEIAFQTNILALNAAVEAARAGDAGMGFAVVAEEVRNLAQRSAQAARETANKIEGAIAKTEQGVVISAKVLEGLQDIVQKVRQVDDLVAEVAAASLEQTQGIDQVAKAINEMDKITQSNAANAEETASASEELSSQAESLKEAVGTLVSLVGEMHVESRSDSKSNSSSTQMAAHPKSTVIVENKPSHPVIPDAKPLLGKNGNSSKSLPSSKTLPANDDFSNS